MSNTAGQMTTQNQIKTLRGMIEQSKGQIQAALPKHMNADKMARIAMTAFLKDPKFLDIDPRTLMARVMDCAQLGLEPDGFLGSAYLLPFRNNKEQRMDCQLIIGYRGLIDLAYRSGKVSLIKSGPVYEAEPFDWDGMVVSNHKPLSPSKRGKDVIGVYAVAIMTDGNRLFEFMWTEEITEVGKGSKAYKFGPWQTHWLEMAKKTVVRRLAKFLPLSPEVQRAAAIDEYQEQVGALPSIEVTAERPALIASIAEEEPAAEEKTKPKAEKKEKPETSSLGTEFSNELLTYTCGDVKAAEKLCREITFYKAPTAKQGSGLSLERLEGANVKRLQIARAKLHKMIQEDSEKESGQKEAAGDSGFPTEEPFPTQGNE